MDRGIFICHNLLSVYKSIAFANQKGISNPHIIYYDKAVQLSDEIERNLSKKYDIYICRYKTPRNSWMRFVSWRKSASDMINQIRRLVRDNPKVDLYLYLDHWEIMPTIIDYFSSKVPDNRICILEEGLGLYSPYQPLTEAHFGIKKILFDIIGLSSYCFTTCTIGVHPKVNTVFCQDVGRLRNTKKINSEKIKYEGKIITTDNSMMFLKALGFSDDLFIRELMSFKYVFLTQPMTSILESRKLDTLIGQIIDVLKQHGRVLIKKHPRDTSSYYKYVNESVIICKDDYNLIPFECFFPLVNQATLITFNSSCCNNVETNNKSIFLYRLLQNEEFSALCDKTISESDKIEIVNSIEELVEIL